MDKGKVLKSIHKCVLTSYDIDVEYFRTMYNHSVWCPSYRPGDAILCNPSKVWHISPKGISWTPEELEDLKFDPYLSDYALAAQILGAAGISIDGFQSIDFNLSCIDGCGPVQCPKCIKGITIRCLT